MQLKRVVITGAGAVSPLGTGVPALIEGLRENRSAVQIRPELAQVGGLRTRVAAVVPDFDPMRIPRKFRRSMSPMSMYATVACQEAVDATGLGGEELADGHTGVAVGSTTGSTQASQEFFREFLRDGSLERMKATLFFQIMNHSCAANVAQALGIRGRILAPSAACATGCQAIGYGYEMIAAGLQQRMLCGGADEFHPLTAGTFDVINAASTGYNEYPERTPRPFDRDRDGIVCGEGAGIVVLESLDQALERGAPILGEVCGFATLSDPSSIANPSAEAMQRCMQEALDRGGLIADEIGFVNAHATATAHGDAAESAAIHGIFGDRVPVNSLKGHIGHTMAASGALELIACLEMMAEGRLVGTRNLEVPAPDCAPIRHARHGETSRFTAFLKNNFAMGGVNSSVAVRRFSA